MDESEKRMAGDYEITHGIHIGDREVVFGENPNADPGARYMCGYAKSNDLFTYFEECRAGGNYLELMRMFTERLQGQIEKVEVERAAESVPDTVLTAAHCFPNDYGESIDGKVVAIRADSIRPEYRTATHQLVLVTGGFGSAANSRGRAVYCKYLHDGRETRWNRSDIQGAVKPEHLPEWAKERLTAIRAGQQAPARPDSPER